MKNYECVIKGEYEADPFHADYRVIQAETRNKAKSIFCKIMKCDYTEVLCKTEKQELIDLEISQWCFFV